VAGQVEILKYVICFFLFYQTSRIAGQVVILIFYNFGILSDFNIFSDFDHFPFVKH